MSAPAVISPPGRRTTGPETGTAVESSCMSSESSPVVHIVDDDEDLRQSLAFLLQSVGIDALTYATATSFLEEADLDEPGVVIVDVRMPG